MVKKGALWDDIDDDVESGDDEQGEGSSCVREGSMDVRLHAIVSSHGLTE